MFFSIYYSFGNIISFPLYKVKTYLIFFNYFIYINSFGNIIPRNILKVKTFYLILFNYILLTLKKTPPNKNSIHSLEVLNRRGND